MRIHIMKMLFIFCSVLLMFLIDSTNARKKCTTPDNKAGICMSLRDCAPLMSIVTNFSSLNPANQNLIRQSRCVSELGTGMLNPHCCPQPREDKKATERRARYVLPTPGECGIETKERIRSGTTTSITDFPWMALINYSKPRRRGAKVNKVNIMCSGSLISKNYVLTAAHCVTGKIIREGWQPTSVRLGEHNIRTSPDYDSQDEPKSQTNAADPGVDVEVSEVIVHNDYVPFSLTPYDDIALLRLSRSLQFTDFIKPICLPVASQFKNKNYDNDVLVVAGFGRTENGTYSDVKIKLDLPGFNWEQCNSVFQGSLGPNELCAGGEKNKDSCGGDSGGPLVATDRTPMPFTYLVGIVSRGSLECGTKGIPGIYTRVDKYLEWIMQNLKE